MDEVIKPDGSPGAHAPLKEGMAVLAIGRDLPIDSQGFYDRRKERLIPWVQSIRRSKAHTPVWISRKTVCG